VQLHGRIEDIAAAGMRLVLIGTGTPEQAEDFEQVFAPGIDILVDPDLVGYRAARLKRGLFATYNPRSSLAMFRAFRNGFRSGPTQGDALQLGGAFVISPEPRTLMSHISSTIHDRAALDRILEEVQNWRAHS
jgi:hypothetical protein